MIDYAKPVLDFMATLSVVNGQVSVRHKTGRYTRMVPTTLPNGDVREVFDTSSFTNEFMVDVNSLVVREGNNAGGHIRHVVINGNGRWYDIVRVDNGRLTIGDNKLPTWMA